MHTKSFFSPAINPEKNRLLEIVDLPLFQEQSLQWIKQQGKEDTLLQWQLFIKNMMAFSENQSICLLLMKRAFICIETKIESGELAQFVTLFRHLKSLDGLYLIHALLKAPMQPGENTLELHIRIVQLLLDLHAVEGIFSLAKSALPHLTKVLEKLQDAQEKHFARLYPKRNIDTVLAAFMEKTDLLQFPLDALELSSIKKDYLAIQDHMPELNKLPQSVLTEKFHAHGLCYKNAQKPEDKQNMFAILFITLRRIMKISAYDTQMCVLLALVNKPEKLKGRIGQIKTGEGKSTIIALLCSFMASQDYYPDMVTSSGYLAIRDCNKYRPFYHALGITVSHISHEKPRQEHFHARILYGTNTDFEFAMLRDGLYNTKLRYSINAKGEIIPRPYDVAIIDEVDNLFLDVALNAAQMGIRDYDDVSFVYKPILEFARKNPEGMPDRDIFRQYLKNQIESTHYQALHRIEDKYLLRWLSSARTALFKKTEKKDYIVLDGDIVIVDYAITGRTHKGSQWQHKIHQFLQLKHGLALTAPSKTAASVSHPAYFTLYTIILGLTGTMGGKDERLEIQKIYQVDSFDAPPHISSIRKREQDVLCQNEEEHRIKLKEFCMHSKKQGRPALILFETIEESDAFSAVLKEAGVQHQLLNEMQREAEDHLVSRAGDAGVITVATNTAGRGTDIILSPESIKNGGAQIVYTFYPANLRVEEQGFGRAGRQGKPGSCNMILNLQAPSMLSSPYSGVLLQHLILNPSGIAESFIECLNKVRSLLIKEQSRERIEGSAKEQLYFSKLQDFFNRMSSVYLIVESPEFHPQILQVCEADVYQKEITITPERIHPDWIILKETLKPLLENKAQGLPVDWTAFIKQFNAVYLDYIRDTWATFYSQLRDPLTTSTENGFEKIDKLLKDPINMAKTLLDTLCAHIMDNLEVQNTRVLYAL